MWECFSSSHCNFAFKQTLVKNVNECYIYKCFTTIQSQGLGCVLLCTTNDKKMNWFLWKLSSIWMKHIWIQIHKFNWRKTRCKLCTKYWKYSCHFHHMWLWCLKKTIVERHGFKKTLFHSIQSKLQIEIYFGRMSQLVDPKPMCPIFASRLPSSLKLLFCFSPSLFSYLWLVN